MAICSITTNTNFQNRDKSIQKLSISDFDSILSQNNLVFADLHTLWCMPCRKISPVIDELKEEYSVQQNSSHRYR